MIDNDYADEHRHLEVRTTLTAPGCAPTPALLRYDPADPYACHLILTEDNTWVFARDLLADGLHGALGYVGCGDVRVQTTEHHVWLTLISGGEQVACYVPRRDVARFVAVAYRLVPHGAERVDVDAAVGQIRSWEGQP
jgi:Streptomyces sporulation and cell division protein, SsgA